MTRSHLFVDGAALVAALAIAPPLHAQCTTSADCRAGRICGQSGECLEQSCSKDIDCPGSGTCEAHVCRPPVPLATKGVSLQSVVVQPAEYRAETTGIPALYITGAVTFGVTWITTIAVTAAVAGEPDKGTAVSFASIPLVGPWVMLGSDLDTHDYTAPLVMSGVLQGSGVVLTVLGLAIRHETKVPVYALGSKPDAPTVSVLPSAGGAVLVGTF